MHSLLAYLHEADSLPNCCLLYLHSNAMNRLKNVFLKKYCYTSKYIIAVEKDWIFLSGGGGGGLQPNEI